MKKITTILAILLLGSFLVAGNTMALPTLYDITGIAGTEGYTDSGASAVYLTDTDGSYDDVTAFLLFEFAGYINDNTFGIYGFSYEGENLILGDSLEVFNGPTNGDHTDNGVQDVFPPSTTLRFDLGNGTVTNQGTAAEAEIGSTFGFYITTPDNYTFYSHDIFTTVDSFNHALLFDTSDDSVSGLLGSDVVVAFEDLLNGGDGDWNDMVVGISDVKPVPEPATMFLLGTGLIGLAAIGRKKFIK